MTLIADHAQRYQLANELHARPFPFHSAPGMVAFLALKEPENAAQRDRSGDRKNLIELLDRFGAPHPKEDATHYFGDLGRFKLKWEAHTEFVTYTIFLNNLSEKPFDGICFDAFPCFLWFISFRTGTNQNNNGVSRGSRPRTRLSFSFTTPRHP